MITENALRELFESKKHMLNIWGNYVVRTIENNLKKNGYNISALLKLPTTPRVKDTKSFLDKAFYRGKKYINPYNDITDKVGARFVVLTLNELNYFNDDILNNGSVWSKSKDKDFEQEKEKSPERFTYQSVHYVIKSKIDQKIDNVDIDIGTTCEIQIRTLLQHAYAELSHDVAYKKEQNISSNMLRKIARSMALIEASDELFKEVEDMIISNDKEYDNYILMAKQINDYSEITSVNKYIYNAFKDTIISNNIDIEAIKEYVRNKKPFLLNTVAENKSISLIYEQPIIWFIYYMITNYPNLLRENFPLEHNILQPFFTDLGQSLENS